MHCHYLIPLITMLNALTCCKLATAFVWLTHCVIVRRDGGPVGVPDSTGRDKGNVCDLGKLPWNSLHEYHYAKHVFGRICFRSSWEGAHFKVEEISLCSFICPSGGRIIRPLWRESFLSFLVTPSLVDDSERYLGIVSGISRSSHTLIISHNLL